MHCVVLVSPFESVFRHVQTFQSSPWDWATPAGPPHPKPGLIDSKTSPAEPTTKRGKKRTGNHADSD